VKEIELLRYKKSLLQQKISAKKNAQQQVVTNVLKKIDIKNSISIDYVELCYNI